MTGGPGFRVFDRDQGISQHIDLFMEELRLEQEARDQRNAEFEKHQNGLRTQNNQMENEAMILHDREVAGEKDDEDWEEEYVVLDLDDAFHGAPIPNFTYTLSGLDTLNPMLTLDNGLKLIGQYMETVGTVVVYSEKEKDVLETQADTREFPVPADPYSANTVKKPLKRIRGVCKLERKLKFCAMPIQEAPATSDMFMQSAYVQNATLVEDVSLINSMPASSTEDVSLENTMQRQDAPVENAGAMEGASLENVTAVEVASLDNTSTMEDTSLETATAREDALVENATTTERASVESARETEGSSL